MHVSLFFVFPPQHLPYRGGFVTVITITTVMMIIMIIMLLDLSSSVALAEQALSAIGKRRCLQEKLDMRKPMSRAKSRSSFGRQVNRGSSPARDVFTKPPRTSLDHVGEREVKVQTTPTTVTDDSAPYYMIQQYLYVARWCLIQPNPPHVVERSPPVALVLVFGSAGQQNA